MDSSPLRNTIAGIAGTPASAVSIIINDFNKWNTGSVIVVATITVPTTSTAAAVMDALSARLGSADAASTALGITVESEPVIREGGNITSEEDTNVGLTFILVALIFLLPPTLCMVYVLIRYRGKECEYISYRFSHTNPNYLGLSCLAHACYMPKERRDALWADISAPKEKTGKRRHGAELLGQPSAPWPRPLAADGGVATRSVLKEADAEAPAEVTDPSPGGVSAYRVRGGMFTPSPRRADARKENLKNFTSLMGTPFS